MIDPDNQQEFGLLLHNYGKEEYVWNARDLLGYLLLHDVTSSDFWIIPSEPAQL